jgi:hypothetical protein
VARTWSTDYMRKRIAESTSAQGLSEHVEDISALSTIAAILSSPARPEDDTGANTEAF